MSPVVVYTIDWIKSFLNSNFTAALAGALAGALAAQKISERAQQRESLSAEIRNANAAILIAFTICNQALALKKQFVLEVHSAYARERKRFAEFKSLIDGGRIPKTSVFEFSADFRIVQTPEFPIAILKQLVFEKISTPMRALGTVAALDEASSAISGVMRTRSEIVERFRQGQSESPIFLELYFGLPFGPGHVNREFSDSIQALSEKTDDVIFFSELLCKDLMDHCERLVSNDAKLARQNTEQPVAVDFSIARSTGLMPETENYRDWLNGFKTPEREQQSFWRMRWFRSKNKRDNDRQSP